jgi:aryl-alcohol dehydrogenase-like predicted oxidoreductase
VSKTSTQRRLVPGSATADGTHRLAEQHATGTRPGFYRRFGGHGLQVSALGIGTYLGACDGADDDRYTAAVRHALSAGINLVDTAINYRCQRSERNVGQSLQAAIDAGELSRDEVVICTKGGYIPLDGHPPEGRDAYRAYLEREYFDAGIMTPEDVVAGGHSLAPAFIADQIQRSRRNLGVETIDVYYLHNPEQQLDVLDRDALYDRLAAAFGVLEEKCRAGEIGCYGVATWNGLRVAPEDRGHLGLLDVHGAAVRAGGEQHHFRVVQLPVNLAFTEGVRSPTQQLLDGQRVPLIHAAAELGVSVVASATLLQSKLTTGLPSQLRNALPGCTTDAQRAIAFVLSLPVITAALVGMRTSEHVAENLRAVW